MESLRPESSGKGTASGGWKYLRKCDSDDQILIISSLDITSGIFSQNTEDFALNADIARRSEDGSHLGVGGLEADHISLTVEALEGGVCTVDEGHDDLSLTGGAGSLDQDIVAGDDVLIPHGVAANLEGEDLAIADDVGERDAFGGLDGLYRLASCNAAEEGETVGSLFAGAGGEDIDGAAAVVSPLKQAFVLEIGDVLVDRGK
jgi:hypothetical protein